MPAQGQPPPPVGLRLGCGEDWRLCLGVERGSQLREGPQGTGHKVKFLGFPAAWALDWLGVEGRRTRRQPTASQKKAGRPADGAGPRLSPIPCDAGSSVHCLSRGSGDQEAQEKRRGGVGQRTGARGSCPSSNLKALITASGESPGGRKGATPVCQGQGRVLPAFHEPKGN